MPKAETFKMDKPASYRRRLSKNKSGEEVGGRSYTTFIVKQLQKHGGWMTKAELYQRVWQNYHHTYSEDDLKTIKKGVPKWKNLVAWAMAALTGKKVIATANRDGQGVRRGIIVLLGDPRVPRELLDLATSVKRKRGFCKRCLQCKAWVRLSAARCPCCGYEFPPPNPKTEKIPV